MTANPTLPDKLRSKAPLIWLIFSLYYFMALFFVDYSPTEISLFVAAYAVFVVLYLWLCYRARREQVRWLLLAMVANSIAATELSAGTDIMFAYTSFFLGLYYPPRWFIPALVALLATILVLGHLHQFPFPFFVATGILISVATGLLGALERQRLQTLREQQRSSDEIRQLAQIAERERIARDLHDILGHRLSSVALKTELADKLLSQGKTDDCQRQLRELNQIARDGLQLVRETVSGYRHKGLGGEVTELCERLRQNHFAVTLDGELPDVNTQTESTLILALTELTTNVLRHSRGDRCFLRFQTGDERLIVTLEDNGRNARIEPGNGLKGVRERLEAIGGRLELHGGAHTRAELNVPRHPRGG